VLKLGHSSLIGLPRKENLLKAHIEDNGVRLKGSVPPAFGHILRCKPCPERLRSLLTVINEPWTR